MNNKLQIVIESINNDIRKIFNEYISKVYTTSTLCLLFSFNLNI